MKKSLQRIGSDIRNFKWVILIFLVYYFLSHIVWGAYCPMLLTTGLPCPGCGMTRAIFFIFTFRFQRAWNLNPVSFIWALLLVLFIFIRYLLGKKTDKLKPLLVIALLGTIGIYGYRMIFEFPSSPPMVYRSNNLLSYVLKGYEKMIRIIWNF